MHYVKPSEAYLATLPFSQRVIEENLYRLEVAMQTRYAPRQTKNLIWARVGELQAEGYVDDVAFVIALREFRII